MASAAESYKKVGRGGAGNFYSKKDVEDVKGKGKASDVEAQPSATLTRDLAAALVSSQQASEYLHTGRGGAGNWIQPSELVSQGLSQNAPRDQNLTAETPLSSLPTPTSSSTRQNRPHTQQRPVLPSKTSSSSNSNVPRYRGGRGGAGNYSVPDTEAMRKERERKERVEEEAAIRAVEERIRLDVEKGLAKPAKAYGGIGGTWEMGPVGSAGKSGRSDSRV